MVAIWGPCRAGRRCEPWAERSGAGELGSEAGLRMDEKSIVATVVGVAESVQSCHQLGDHCLGVLERVEVRGAAGGRWEGQQRRRDFPSSSVAASFAHRNIRSGGAHGPPRGRASGSSESHRLVNLRAAALHLITARSQDLLQVHNTRRLHSPRLLLSIELHLCPATARLTPDFARSA